MTEQLPSSHLLLTLTALRDRALGATSLNALAFSMANDLYPLVPFRQALVFAQHEAGLELLCVSGLAKPSEDSPYLIWLRRAMVWVSGLVPGEEPKWLAREALNPPPVVEEGWAEWWPDGLFVVPVLTPDKRRVGLLVLLLETPPPPLLQQLLQGLWQTWGYCWSNLAEERRLFRWRPTRRQLIGAGVALALLLLLPVRQTVLAPAEVVSLDTEVISAPLDGVIEAMLVRPNQAVEAATPLFRLDETTLRSRAAILSQEVAVADAELLAASQRAFDVTQSKSELTVLSGRAQQKRAELAAVQAQLKRTTVLAPDAGVAVFSDPNDWIGKPVVTGERILQLSNPATPAVRVQLPVADAIALDVGAKVVVFLTAYPLSPLYGQVLETSYQAKAGDDGVVSYRLLVGLDEASPQARLGLYGTAKLYGGRVPLGYYLLRRPLSALRAWSGF